MKEYSSVCMCVCVYACMCGGRVVIVVVVSEGRKNTTKQWKQKDTNYRLGKMYVERNMKTILTVTSSSPSFLSLPSSSPSYPFLPLRPSSLTLLYFLYSLNHLNFPSATPSPHTLTPLLLPLPPSHPHTRTLSCTTLVYPFWQRSLPYYF